MRALIAFVLVAWATTALAHDAQRPDLDNWYESLHRKGMAKCCNKQDCHRTDAEVRPDKDGLGKSHWWARIGEPVYETPPAPGASSVYVPKDWNLGPYVEIPDEIIVKDDQGKPIHNPEGEAVFCHATGQNVPTKASNLYCFVLPAEY